MKDAAITGQTGAEEKRRSDLSIIRSHTFRETNKLAQMLQTYKDDNKKDHVPIGFKLTVTFLSEVERQAEIDMT